MRLNETDIAPAARVHDDLAEAASRWAFAEVSRLLDGLALPRKDLHQARRLARAGDVLLRLDLEDLDRPSEVREPLRAALRAVRLPQAPTIVPEGLLASLRPVAALLLDVIAVRYRQRQVSELLAAVHLLAEALPLLAWEDVLGHSGDPTRLLRLVSRPGSLWGTERCHTTGPARGAARRLRSAPQDPDHWQEYLERSWSLLGDQLQDCASCHLSCAVANLAERRRVDLARRVEICVALSRSAILGERHGSAVGHAFAVPDLAELDRSWGFTRTQLSRLVPGVLDDDPHPFPGLREAVAAVAGTPVPDTSVLVDVKASLDLEIALLRKPVLPSERLSDETERSEPDV